MSPSNWKLDQAKFDAATQLGESVVAACGITTAPIDPFAIIRLEGRRILAYGEDFGDAFDGRLEYRQTHFLLAYNTRYDAWPHAGLHHPKVLFTVGHELGHYFLEEHCRYLMGHGGAHGSFSDFSTDNRIEREADCFAVGLLMPKQMLRPIVNRQPPALEPLQSTRETFAVSLTSMMVRWVQLCDFPCAMVSVRGQRIEWGFTSDAFKKVGGYCVRRGAPVSSRPAIKFIQADPSQSTFRKGNDWGIAERWIEYDGQTIEVREYYVVVPSTRQVLVFLTANEDEVGDARDWE